MDPISITVSAGAREAAFAKARAAYAASNGNISSQDYLQKLVDGILDGLVGSYVKATLTKLEFLDRFTLEERVTIREAGKLSPQVNDYLEMLNAASEVSLTSARTVGGVQALEAAGLLAAGRAAEILAL